MAESHNANLSGESDYAFDYSMMYLVRRLRRQLCYFLSVLVCIAHFLTLAYLARQHPFGTYATETDFYHYYAPDAERIASGQFPQNTYQGPGYPVALALVAKLAGRSGDLFTIGKWLSVVCAVICGLLVFELFARLFGHWVGLGAQAIAIVSGAFPTFSINAGTDVFFLLLCLTAMVVFTGYWLPPRWRVALGGGLAGLAYITRYNGLFLLVAAGIGILLLDLFARAWRERCALAAVFLAAFLLAASPWLVANFRHHSSPLYNTNYLNIATEFYPELAANKTNQDATRALSERFHSFGDVLWYDPLRLFKRYPINLYESLQQSFAGDLVHAFTAWMAWLGILFVFWNRRDNRRSKAAIWVLMAGALYFLLLGLTHWETRYYFFVMVLYAGFAVYAAMAWLKRARDLGWCKSSAFTLIPITMIAMMLALSLGESRNEVRAFLDSHPTEIPAARDYLARMGAMGGKRIVARKPHLPYLSRNEWVFFPQVKSLDEFRAWVEANRVDYIAVGKRELKERKELKALGDPSSAPDWLRAVWVNDDPAFILYQPAVGIPAQTP